jgi:hypothetical protein
VVGVSFNSGVGRNVGCAVGGSVGVIVGRTVGSGSTIATGGGVGGNGVAFGTIRASSLGGGGFGGAVTTGRGRGRTGTGTGAGTTATRGRTMGRGDRTGSGSGLGNGAGVSTVICVSATTDSGAPPSKSACNTNTASTTSAIAWMRIEQRYATANLRRSPGVRRTPRFYRLSGPMASQARVRAFVRAAIRRNFVPNAGPYPQSYQVVATCFHV